MAENIMDKLTSLAKRRGFVYPSSEIYGGLSAIYDFGPLGTLLKRNIRDEWWKRFVQQRDDIVGIESALITRREVLQASGHESSFTDPLVECKICHQRFRADQEITQASDHQHDLTEPKSFNLMFKTYVGPTEEEGNLAYLRPETAQGMFTNFKNIIDSTRIKMPFGIAQVGKSFRNEITTGEWLFRLRELEIAEIEYFVKPGTDEEWFGKWVSEWEAFFTDLGLKPENLKHYQHPQQSLAHYSKGTTDLLYNFPIGWKELAGIANRTDFDLKAHTEASGKDLSFFDEETKEKYVPYVIEPTLGIERAFFAFLTDAYAEEDDKEGTRAILRFHPKLAPIKAAVFPLQKSDELVKVAQEIYKNLQQNYMVQYDQSGSVGRRYRRQDEIGTPYCITVDFDSLQDKKVTVRDRDTMEQQRVAISELTSYLANKLN